MPSTRRWTVSPRRTVVSVVLGVLATFMICASAGAESWVMAALGLAVMAAGVGLYVVAALNSREFAYVPGTANVQSCSPPPASALYGRCTMQLIVHAPGTDDVAVKIRETGVPVSKWPHEGSTLPILVAIGDRRRVRVLWDNVRSHADVADGLLATEEPTEEETPVEDAYIGDLLDQDYQDPDEEPMPSVDPTTRVIELDLMDPTVFRVSSADDDLEDLPDLILPDPDEPFASDDEIPVDGNATGDTGSYGVPGEGVRGAGVPGDGVPGDEVPAARRPVDEPSGSVDGGAPIDAPLVDALWPTGDAPSTGDPDSTGVQEAPGIGESPGISESPGIGESPGIRESPGAAESTGVRPPATHPGSPTGRPGEPVRRPVRRRPSPRPRRPVPDEMIDSPDQGAVMTAEPPPATGPSRTVGITVIPDPADLTDLGAATGTGARDTDEAPASAPDAAGPASASLISASPASASPTSASPTSADPTSASPTSADPTSADPAPPSEASASEASASRGPAGAASAAAAASAAGSAPAAGRSPESDPAGNQSTRRRTAESQTAGSQATGRQATGSQATGGRTADDRTADDRSVDEPVAPATKAPPTRRGTSLRVEHVLSPEPAVPAMPRSSVVGDLAEDGEISEAYLAVTPPPGQPEPGGVRGAAVRLFVSHLGRSVAFYRDTLGFIQVDMGLGSAVLESGDCRVELRRVVDMEPVDTRLIHLMLEVPDVHGAYEDLRSRGVEFVHRPRAVSRHDQLELWSAAFRDPDGHGIALIRWDVR